MTDADAISFASFSSISFYAVVVIISITLPVQAPAINIGQPVVCRVQPAFKFDPAILATPNRATEPPGCT
jgi:hypothetical protein